MIVKVPLFAEKIEDEGILTLVAFCTRIAERYGYEENYSMHKEDLIRICNKRGQAVIEWLQTDPILQDWLTIGQPLDTVVIFNWKQKPPNYKYGKASHYTNLIEKELTSTRQRLIWAYLLGCLNTNVIEQDELPDWLTNTYGQKSFYLNREGVGFVKKLNQIEPDEE